MGWSTGHGIHGRDLYLDDLSTVGFKDFNPMWSFPTTSVNQVWELMTFGMAPWHLISDTDRSKQALQSQSPIAACSRLVMSLKR